MCGIAGILNLNGESVSPVTLRKMTDAISHRGPDGEGHWIDASIGLGHRRLSIIDPSPAGSQPMISADHRWVLSYNGEVYNYRELRIELQAEGVWFSSNTDSEVVLYALARWGADAIRRFNGMFAIALWDRKEKRLLLARDRYGIKPLYYSKQSSRFSFGSEQKAILADSGFKRSLNASALLEYFTFQNIFTDQTLIDGIRLLPAGHYLLIGAETSSTPAITQYWDYHFREPGGKVDKLEYLEELDRLLRQAVNRQLVSDVELGAYLSGGMDSGSISSIASLSLPDLKTFTCGFDLSSASGIELGYDERGKAELMSARFGTEHYEVVLKAGDMERCLPTVAWHLEEPRVGQSYPNFYAAKLTSKFVRVVLSGTGGDELFGGYPWRYYRALDCQNFEEYVDHYYLFWQRLVDNQNLKQMFMPLKGEVGHVWTRDIFRNVFSNNDNQLSSPEDFINHSLYFEAKTFLHGLFVVEDKLSMSHGLESRVPFMDNDLVDFAMKCPVSLKLNRLSEVVIINENQLGDKKKLYFQKTNDGKQILRDVMNKYLPEEIVKAEKQGFSSPDASWFRGDSIDFVRERLLNKSAPIYSFLSFDAVSPFINDHLSGKENRRLLIWSLLSVDEFIKQYI